MKISHRLNIVIFTGSLAGIAVAVWIAWTALSSADRTKEAVEKAFEGLRYAVEFRNLMSAAHDNVQNVMRMDSVENIPSYAEEHQRLLNVMEYVSGEIAVNALAFDQRLFRINQYTHEFRRPRRFAIKLAKFSNRV